MGKKKENPQQRVRVVPAKDEEYVDCPRYCRSGQTRKIHYTVCSWYLEHFDDPQCRKCPTFIEQEQKKRKEIAERILF